MTTTPGAGVRVWPAGTGSSTIHRLLARCAGARRGFFQSSRARPHDDGAGHGHLEDSVASACQPGGVRYRRFFASAHAGEFPMPPRCDRNRDHAVSRYPSGLAWR